MDFVWLLSIDVMHDDESREDIVTSIAREWKQMTADQSGSCSVER